MPDVVSGLLALGSCDAVGVALEDVSGTLGDLHQQRRRSTFRVESPGRPRGDESRWRPRSNLVRGVDGCDDILLGAPQYYPPWQNSTGCG